MGFSACLITHNEEELLPYCLKWLNSLTNLAEICIIDDFSTDKTWEIITNFKTDKKYKFKQQKFISFGAQKNDCISMSTEEWILLIDADETYSYQIDRLMKDINDRLVHLRKINAFRIPTLVTYPDKKHFINDGNLDPHVRIWRKSFCRYFGECHERLFDSAFRDLHITRSSDILYVIRHKYYDTIMMLHHQLLKSKDSLINKGKRWAELDMLRKSAEQELPVSELSWLNSKEILERGLKAVQLIPEASWDFKE